MRGWRAGLFTLLTSVAHWLDLGGRASTYLAAGTLRRDDLRGALAARWAEFGRSDDLVHSGLMSWERALYDRFLEPGNRVFVIGCGTGRDLMALLKAGYHAAGLDVVPEAIALARETLDKAGLHAELYTGSIEMVELPGAFDVFPFSWFCYGYIPGSEARIAVLRKLSARLNPEGRVLISYNPAERRPRALPITLTRFAARVTGSDWRPERGDVVVRATEARHAIHYEHQFVDGELQSEARAAGLRVIFEERGHVGTAALTV